jgi:hypothetical protein
MVDLNDFLDALQDDEFEETPVDLTEFVTDTRYLGLPPLSDNQYVMLKAMTQIYKRETLHRWLGEEEGEKRWKQTCNEVIFQLGKGSGKDYTSTIAAAYISYLLLCLKDPAQYYGKPSGDSIDILNIAINAVQANNVFFKGFKARLDKSPWFVGKYNAKAGSVEFPKNITVHSGHSEREAWEGYNVMVVVLDEISGFAMESTTGHDQSKTGSAIYDMYRASVSSRFPDFGKLILLSFPRFKNDFIQQKYEEVISQKEVVIKSHTFILNPELPEDEPGNKFSVQWEEDRIVAYKIPNVYALKRPTWEINPTRKIEDFKIEFYRNAEDALSRFACMPPEAVDAFFKSREKVEGAFNNPNLAVDNAGRFADWFNPLPDKEYFLHIDLAQKHDHCAVAMAHVDKWVNLKVGNEYAQTAPVVVVDAVRFWTPTASKSVDFTEVKDYIVSLKQRGFNLKLTTFDRWNSHDMMQQLKGYGINTELLSVAKKHYEDFALILAEERVKGPAIQLLIDEMLQLRIMRDKVDHPRKGSKDLADAVCGAIYNSMYHSKRSENKEVEIHTFRELQRDNYLEEMEKQQKENNVVRPPRKMPADLADALEGMGII